MEGNSELMGYELQEKGWQEERYVIRDHIRQLNLQILERIRSIDT